MSKFIIGTTDLTAQINDKTAYEVNTQKIFSSITDANGREYRNNYKTKIVGSFDMFFVTGYGVEYSDFLTLITNATTNGELVCSIYSQNISTLTTISCFCDIIIKKEQEVNGKTVRIVNIKIEEC